MKNVKYTPYYYNQLKSESPALLKRIEEAISKGHTANTIANELQTSPTAWTIILAAARYLEQTKKGQDQ